MRANQEPAVGIIGGSGLYEIDGIGPLERRQVITPYGDPSDAILEGRLAGRRVCFLPRHGVGHRLLAHEVNHRANVWALRSLGVRWVISVTAVGSLREGLEPREAVVPHQLLDRTGRAHEHTFFGRGLAAHVGFADPYAASVRAALLEAARACGRPARDGATYVCMNGPAFSTRAEAAFHRLIGGDLIGMTNAGEARLCREAEIAMATLALVTDHDCWRDEDPAVEVSQVLENLQANSELAKDLVRAALGLLPTLADEPEHRALESAILTPRQAWPENRRRELWPLLDRIDPPAAP